MRNDGGALRTMDINTLRYQSFTGNQTGSEVFVDRIIVDVQGGKSAADPTSGWGAREPDSQALVTHDTICRTYFDGRSDYRFTLEVPRDA